VALCFFFFASVLTLTLTKTETMKSLATSLAPSLHPAHTRCSFIKEESESERLAANQSSQFLIHHHHHPPQMYKSTTPPIQFTFHPSIQPTYVKSSIQTSNFYCKQPTITIEPSQARARATINKKTIFYNLNFFKSIP
jgi:hypothetical protein